MMRKFLPAVSIFLLLLNAAPVSGRKGIEPADYARINATLVETHVLPRYALLLAATEAFAATAKDFCANDDRASRAHMRARFHDAMEAWMGVQHLRFGPVELFLRADRFYFWPQARGKTAAAVRALVAAGAESALLPPRIDRASTAVPSIYSIVPPNDGSALRHGHHFEPVDFVIDHGRGHHDAYSAGSCQRIYARACGCRQRTRCHREELIESERGWSGREAFVTMMQTADLGQGNDRSRPGRLNGSSIRCVLAERQVGP